MEHESVKQKVIQKDLELAELLQKFEALQKEKEAVADALRSQKEKTSKAMQERDDLAEDVRRLQAELRAAEAEIAQLRHRISNYEELEQQKEAAIQKLEVQLEHAQDQVHSQGIELLDKQDIITELERNLRSLQRTIDSQVSHLGNWKEFD